MTYFDGSIIRYSLDVEKNLVRISSCHDESVNVLKRLVQFVRNSLYATECSTEIEAVDLERRIQDIQTALYQRVIEDIKAARSARVEDSLVDSEVQQATPDTTPVAHPVVAVPLDAEVIASYVFGNEVATEGVPVSPAGLGYNESQVKRTRLERHSLPIMSSTTQQQSSSVEVASPTSSTPSSAATVRESSTPRSGHLDMVVFGNQHMVTRLRDTSKLFTSEENLFIIAEVQKQQQRYMATIGRIGSIRWRDIQKGMPSLMRYTTVQLKDRHRTLTCFKQVRRDPTIQQASPRHW